MKEIAYVIAFILIVSLYIYLAKGIFKIIIGRMGRKKPILVCFTGWAVRKCKGRQYFHPTFRYEYANKQYEVVYDYGANNWELPKMIPGYQYNAFVSEHDPSFIMFSPFFTSGEEEKIFLRLLLIIILSVRIAMTIFK